MTKLTQLISSFNTGSRLPFGNRLAWKAFQTNYQYINKLKKNYKLLQSENTSLKNDVTDLKFVIKQINHEITELKRQNLKDK